MATFRHSSKFSAYPSRFYFSTKTNRGGRTYTDIPTSRYTFHRPCYSNMKYLGTCKPNFCFNFLIIKNNTFIELEEERDRLKLMVADQNDILSNMETANKQFKESQQRAFKEKTEELRECTKIQSILKIRNENLEKNNAALIRNVQENVQSANRIQELEKCVDEKKLTIEKLEIENKDQSNTIKGPKNLVCLIYFSTLPKEF